MFAKDYAQGSQGLCALGLSRQRVGVLLQEPDTNLLRALLVSMELVASLGFLRSRGATTAGGEVALLFIPPHELGVPELWAWEAVTVAAPVPPRVLSRGTPPSQETHARLNYARVPLRVGSLGPDFHVSVLGDGVLITESACKERIPTNPPPHEVIGGCLASGRLSVFPVPKSRAGGKGKQSPARRQHLSKKEACSGACLCWKADTAAFLSAWHTGVVQEARKGKPAESLALSVRVQAGQQSEWLMEKVSRRAVQITRLPSTARLCPGFRLKDVCGTAEDSVRPLRI